MSGTWTDQGRLEASGKSLEYACWGPPPDAAPTLVLLHEGLGALALWRDFPQALAQVTGYGVMAYSRAGHGRSDAADLPRPLEYMTHEAVEVLPQVLDAVGFRRGVLVGHSDGASIAAIHAGSIVDARVRGIVCMAPHFFTEEMGLAEIARARDVFDAELRDRMARYHRDPEHTFRGWNDAWLDPEFRGWDITEVIDYIRVPVLAMQGREDQYGTLAQLRVLEDRCYAPVDAVVIENCRHAPFMDHRDRVLGEIAEYCARLDRIEAVRPEGL